MPKQTIPRIFDPNRRILRHQRAVRSSAQSQAADWLDTDMAEDILDRADFMRLPEGRALIMGQVSGSLADDFAGRGFVIEKAALGQFNEEQPWPGGLYDYIFAIRTFATLNDLPGSLLHCRSALSPGGILFAQILGAGSLATLRSIMIEADGDRPAARIHPQIDNSSASALLQRAGFPRQVVDSRTLNVRFSSFERMICDLREQGLTGILADRPPVLTKAGLDRAKAAFERRRDQDGKVSETFNILALTAWR